MKKKRVQSIKKRLMIPLSIILIFQMLFLVLFYEYGGVMSTLRNNAVRIFSETNYYSQLSLEQELLGYWMDNISETQDILNTIEQVLKENGCTAEDIAVNPQLNNSIVSAVTEQLIDMLHYSLGNGIYLVLDGPASVNGNVKEQAGIFLRDLDSSSYQQDQSDLLLKIGPFSIARKYGIAMDRNWELGFDMEETECMDFYTKPFENAYNQNIQQHDAVGCAYFGAMKKEVRGKAQNLSYSIPLILSDGAVVGVIGGEIEAFNIRKFLESDTEAKDKEIVSVLAKGTGKGQGFEPVIVGNAKYWKYFRDMEEISYKDSEWDSVGIIQDKNGDNWYAAINPLNIYSKNTPFSNDEWMVIQLRMEKNLFADINSVYRILLFSVVFTLLVSFLLLFLASHVITNPLRRLMKEIQKVDLNEKPYLNKVRIIEIDELVDEVNRLNAGVAAYASKVSRILDALNMEIGVFEYEHGSNDVYCSYSLLKLLGIECEQGMYQFVSKEEFLKMLSVLRNPVEDENGKTFEFRTETGLHYICMKIMETGTREVIGVLQDVTVEINEHKRLEKERDSDTLTGLYNRRAFKEKVEVLLDSKEIDLAAFVMWDIDNLKYVNDTYGHEVGDRYICMFAEHLGSLKSEGAIVERRSGDEFVAMLYNGTEEELIVRIDRFMRQIKEVTMEVQDGSRIPLRASAGVSWYPRHSDTMEDLIRYADFAMYMSKHSYRGIVQEFDAETYQTNSYLLSGREELNQILESKDVKFALQPIVTREGRIYGYEVLMRPTLKKLKNISELLHLTKIQAKLPQFEELTWFGALQWVSERESSLAQGSRIFINSIANVRLDFKIINQLQAEFGNLMSRVVLELTETEESNQACLASKTEAVRRWNCLLALDDYGTGYSNETTLVRIEPNIVKMDLTLVRDIHTNKNQQAIAKNLIDYCHPRSILVLAEGVETQAELEYLMEIGVDLFQGYYLARPNLEIQGLDPAVTREIQKLSKKGKENV